MAPESTLGARSLYSSALSLTIDASFRSRSQVRLVTPQL